MPARGERRRVGPDYVVDPDTGCWVWQHALNEGYGYGTFDSVIRLAHRHYYELHRGPVPDGLDLDHLCRNRRCCNPDHLEPVTRATNAQRGARARLTADAVRQIRASTDTYKTLAARYGVTKSGIQAVKNGRTWKGIA